uniref:Protein Wnt n=1 Tax=Anopheles culicifacies TaxID=139723 RepID=A0A182LY50_9DIPT
MNLVTVFTVCLMAISAWAEVESKSKPGRGRGSMWCGNITPLDGLVRLDGCIPMQVQKAETVLGGIAKAGEPNNISPLAPGMTYLDPAIHATLRRKQRRLARENEGVLAAIAKGANLAINECQHQFRTRRWNCSTRNFLRGKNLFGKIVEREEMFQWIGAFMTNDMWELIDSLTCRQSLRDATFPRYLCWIDGGLKKNPSGESPIPKATSEKARHIVWLVRA